MLHLLYALALLLLLCGTCAILGRRRRLYKYRLKKLAARCGGDLGKH